MARMKTEFEGTNIFQKRGLIQIVVPLDKKRRPYLRICSQGLPLFIKKDLERFAVNILKALKGKRLSKWEPVRCVNCGGMKFINDKRLKS